MRPASNTARRSRDSDGEFALLSVVQVGAAVAAVVALSASDDVIAGATVKDVVAGGTDDMVVTGESTNPVVTGAPLELIGVRVADDDVGGGGAHHVFDRAHRLRSTAELDLE